MLRVTRTIAIGLFGSILAAIGIDVVTAYAVEQKGTTAGRSGGARLYAVARRAAKIDPLTSVSQE